MTRTLLALAILGVLAAPAEAQAPNPRLQKTLVWATQELAHLEGLAQGCANHREMKRRLAHVRVKLNAFLAQAPEPEAEPAPPEEAAPQPMAAPAFKRLLDSINAQVMVKGKLTVIMQAGIDNYFTTAQVITLLGTVPLSRDKLKALRSVASRITDVANRFSIADQFPMFREKEKARKILVHGR